MSTVRLEIDAQSAERWTVWLDTDLGKGRSVVPAFELAELGISGIPQSISSWRQMMRSIAGSTFGWTAPVLRQIGEQIEARLLRTGEVGQLWAALRAAGDDSTRISITVYAEVDDPLHHLPIELACRDLRFVFKDRRWPSNRTLTKLARRSSRLGAGAKVVVASAHDDHRPPARERMVEHVEHIAARARARGLVVEQLIDATSSSLEAALLEPADGVVPSILYFACHGIAAPDEDGGALLLRDGPLHASRLGRLLSDARSLSAHEAGVEWVLLCACSSAAPGTGAGTASIAEWMVSFGEATAALGFRADVDAEYALRFAESVFAGLDDRFDLQEAVARARHQADEQNGQWVLPLVFVRRPGEPVEREVISRGPVLSPLREVRSYYVPRMAEQQLMFEWLDRPGRATISSAPDAGRVGKTELARVIAREAGHRGMPVVWLDRPDLDVRGTMLSVIRSRDPRWSEGGVEEIGSAFAKAVEGARGLWVVNDVSSRRGLEGILPGAEWNILATAREPEVLSDATVIEVGVLSVPERLQLFSRIVWEEERPPLEARKDAKALVEMLGGLPIAIEVAAGSVRAGSSCAEYLAQVRARAPIVDAVGVVVAHARDRLEEGARRIVDAMAMFPGGVSAQIVAWAIDRSELEVKRALDRLEERRLVSFEAARERFALDSSVRSAVWECVVRSRGAERVMSDAARGILKAAESVSAVMGSRPELARARWMQVRDVFVGLDRGLWSEGPAAAEVARALALVDELERRDG